MTDSPRLQAEFLGSAPDLAHCPPGAGPEVALAGRSNTGKSSVLNRLAGSRLTARTSKTPGRTRLLNFFALPGGARLVDLPGYGYAKASASAQVRWQRTVNHYLSAREQLVGIILVTDIRHPGRALDADLIAWAKAADMPLHLLLNKADKLGRGAQMQALVRARQSLEGDATAQLFSAVKGQGVEELLTKLSSWLGVASEGS